MVAITSGNVLKPNPAQQNYTKLHRKLSNKKLNQTLQQQCAKNLQNNSSLFSIHFQRKQLFDFIIIVGYSTWSQAEKLHKSNKKKTITTSYDKFPPDIFC